MHGIYLFRRILHIAIGARTSMNLLFVFSEQLLGQLIQLYIKSSKANDKLNPQLWQLIEKAVQNAATNQLSFFFLLLRLLSFLIISFIADRRDS